MIHIAALKKYRTIGKIVASKLDRVGHAGKGKCASQPLCAGLRNVPEVLLNVLRVDWPLINLDDLSLGVDQERSWQLEITMPVKKVAIENVIGGSHVLRPAKDRKGKPMLTDQRANTLRIAGGIEVYRKQLETLHLPRGVALIE